MIPSDISILVVDDAQASRDFAREQLISLGYSKITEAVDGAQALQMLTDQFDKGQGFQFVISDWYMPKMTGLELVVKVREIPALKQLPFLLITSEKNMPEVVKAVSAGVSNFIIKPFDKAGLKKKMQEVWNKHYGG